ncbi:MAG: sulfurtransferase-like selenium metabolism protein YedF [Desulfosalsimonadaceae bacterium]
MKEIDARNLACPGPVLLTRDVLEKEKPSKVNVIVNNDASRQNVARFLQSVGYAVSDKAMGADFHVTGTGGSQETGMPEEAPDSVFSDEGPARRILVLITTDRMGYGDDSLGQKLMANFIRTLKEFGPDLWRLVLLNSGVKHAIASSDLVDVLQNLENDGVKIMVCGTCLEHYGLSEAKQAGETTNMLDIVTAMHLADKVITL